MKNAGEVVTSYIRALDQQRYDDAVRLIDDNVRIVGPAGETFAKPADFLDVLKRFHGRYEIKRIFLGEGEVCLLYDYIGDGYRVYMNSWYKVKGERIEFIRTVFDPRAFESDAGKSEP